MKVLIAFILLSVFMAGCGVKSDPLPPLGEEKIGRGKPTFRKAAKKISIPATPADANDDEEDEDESNN